MNEGLKFVTNILLQSDAKCDRNYKPVFLYEKSKILVRLQFINLKSVTCKDIFGEVSESANCLGWNSFVLFSTIEKILVDLHEDDPVKLQCTLSCDS